VTKRGSRGPSPLYSKTKIPSQRKMRRSQQWDLHEVSPLTWGSIPAMK